VGVVRIVVLGVWFITSVPAGVVIVAVAAGGEVTATGGVVVTVVVVVVVVVTVVVAGIAWSSSIRVAYFVCRASLMRRSSRSIFVSSVET
jgi:hypothetical protein